MPPKIAFIAENIIASTCASASSGNVTAINTLREWQSRGQIPPQKNTMVSQALVAGARAAPVKAAPPKTALPTASTTQTTPHYASLHEQKVEDNQRLLKDQVASQPSPSRPATDRFNDAKSRDTIHSLIKENVESNRNTLKEQVEDNQRLLKDQVASQPSPSRPATDRFLTEQQKQHQLSNLGAQLTSRHQEHADEVATRPRPNILFNTVDEWGTRHAPFSWKPYKRISVSSGPSIKQDTSTKYSSEAVSGTRPSQKPLEPEVSGVRGRGEAGPSRSGENFLIPVVKPFARRQIDQNKIFFMPFKDYRESLSKKSEVDTLFEQMNKNKWGLAKGGSVKKKRKK